MEIVANDRLKAQSELRAGYTDCLFGQLHYQRRIGDTRLRPLVLINPRSRSCNRLIPLIDASRPLYIVDVPAYGQSSPPAAPCSMQEVAGAVAEFITAIGLASVHVCGWHTGAKVSAALAQYFPDCVTSLTVCGKSHSLIPDQHARNKAMKDQVALARPDVVVVGLESFVADDSSAAVGRALIYEANFRFDLAAAIGGLKCPTLVVEIVSNDEDQRIGRQGRHLAACSAKASAQEIAECESMGTDLYVGSAVMARALQNFIAEVE